jgi:CBS domain-containing protein
MTVTDLMTPNPACCTPDTSLRDVAKMMVECHCGEIPVAQSRNDKRLVGVVTDRDIVCRALAEGKNPFEMTARDCMSSPIVTVTPQTTLEQCCRIMEENLIRRVPVVDQTGACCGIVSQADIAKRAPERETGELVKEVSRHTEASSRVGSQRPH